APRSTQLPIKEVSPPPSHQWPGQITPPGRAAGEGLVRTLQVRVGQLRAHAQGTPPEVGLEPFHTGGTCRRGGVLARPCAPFRLPGCRHRSTPGWEGTKQTTGEGRCNSGCSSSQNNSSQSRLRSRPSKVAARKSVRGSASCWNDVRDWEMRSKGQASG